SRGGDDLHGDRRRRGGPPLMEQGGAVAERMIIGGEEVDAADGETFATVNPATGDALARLPSAGRGDVERAVDDAHRAFEEGLWPRLHARERGKGLLRMAHPIRAPAEAVARPQPSDNGIALTDS